MPMALVVSELAREIERVWQGAGLSIEELLTGLREQREQYYREQYGDAGTSQAPDFGGRQGVLCRGCLAQRT